jgi:2-octaprenyl-6-methoxyphenol hydroxylase
MALALALHRYGIRSEIFDARRREVHRAEKRILALSHGSRQTLEWLGVWKDIDATPITSIHVSQQGGFGRTAITAVEQGLDALGYVAQASNLIAALDDAIQRAGMVYREQARVEQVNPGNDSVRFEAAGKSCNAALLAYAEGSVGDGADIKSRDYQQHAVVCVSTTCEPHHNQAWERFTPHGPVALLPFGKNFAVVLTCPSATADEIAALDDIAFGATLQQAIGARMHFLSVEPRHVFPLGLRYRRSAIGPRQVWLGNAAQTLHPVAGQGFNLALRDVRQLAQSLSGATDVGDAAMLTAHAKSRRVDRLATITTTDTLVRLFSNDNLLLRHMRGAGLLALDLIPPARSFLARRMMFGARAFP